MWDFVLCRVSVSTKRVTHPNKMKKIRFVVAAVFILALVVGGYKGHIYYQTPKSYVSIDINPSVELSVNAFNRVIAVTSSNDDGKTLLKDQNLANKSVGDAVSQYITSAVENKFIKNDGSTVISVTGISDDGNVAKQLTKVTEKATNTTVNASKLSAAVYKDTSDFSLRKQAENSGVSPGKYKLIKALQSLNPDASIEQLKDASVSEIMNQLKTYIQSDSSQSVKTGLSTEDMQKIAKLVNKQYKQASENKAVSQTKQNQNGDKKDSSSDDQGEHTFNKDNIGFEYNEVGAEVGDTFFVKMITKTQDGKFLDFTGKCDYSFDTSYISYENGQFKALKNGKTTIKAVYKGNDAELYVTIGNQNSNKKNMLFFNMNDLSVGLNSSGYFQVLAVENGKKTDVTSQCKFEYDSSIIKVANNSISGLKMGTTIIKAKYKDMTASAKVNVIEKSQSQPDKDISAEISRAQRVEALARDYGVDIKGLQIDEAEQKVREAIAAWQGVSISGLSPAQADELLARTKNNQMTAEGILFQNAAGLLGLNSNAITPVMKKDVGSKLGINFDGMTLEQEAIAIQDALAKLGLKLP